MRNSVKTTYTAAAICLMAVATAFFSCTHKAYEKPLPATVSFSNDIEPVFTSDCNGSGCHSTAYHAANLDLTPDSAYIQLFRKKDIDTTNPSQSTLYLQMASVGTPMPPTGKLDDYYVNLVLKWIQQGAKNN